MHTRLDERTLPYVQELISKADELQAFPATTARLASLLAQDDWVLAEIAETVGLDAPLTGKILAAANSASSGSRQTIATVEAAIARLGPGAVLSLAIASVVGEQMHKPVQFYGLQEGELWQHSVASALAADQIGKHCPASIPPETLPAALLHDVGKMVVSLHAQQSSSEAGAMLGGEASAVDPAEVGGLVAQSWKLPASIATAITFHRNPDAAPREEDRLLACVVGLADVVAHRVGHRDGEEPAQLSVDCVRRLRMDRSTFDAVYRATSERFQETLDLYG